ncbi:hypothetical protein XI09_40960 [Bradyrhizobium sp. CCBAU 11386]|uniref:hypothetical protein n=1 Tax=Bradyrhizobium sp. CCBAU 11386 TaxID=1630837 RepID=UPI0023044E35|nr:hypothetical protein [Bradyrhizobium sp. CCBAU 11386]MDA9510921.1 hypothetical protein [Bradyrhizobium sp. CCBAU 11386]
MTFSAIHIALIIATSTATGANLVAWKQLTDIDGRSQHVNLDNVAYITAEGDRSWIAFAGRGGQGFIGTIAVREKPSEILKGVS